MTTYDSIVFWRKYFLLHKISIPHHTEANRAARTIILGTVYLPLLAMAHFVLLSLTVTFLSQTGGISLFKQWQYGEDRGNAFWIDDHLHSAAQGSWSSEKVAIMNQNFWFITPVVKRITGYHPTKSGPWSSARNIELLCSPITELNDSQSFLYLNVIPDVKTDCQGK